jgi:hypothetical protein
VDHPVQLGQSRFQVSLGNHSILPPVPLLPVFFRQGFPGTLHENQEPVEPLSVTGKEGTATIFGSILEACRRAGAGLG